MSVGWVGFGVGDLVGGADRLRAAEFAAGGEREGESQGEEGGLHARAASQRAAWAATFAGAVPP